jgi:putative ABC transport system ATP-binding protein
MKPTFKNDNPMTDTNPMDRKKNCIDPTIEVAGLNYCFGEHDNRIQVLFGVDLTVYPGEVVLVTGPSGSGKTTLLSLIGGLRSNQRGRLRVLDMDLENMAGKGLQQVRKKIGFIFQTHNLFRSLTARQTLLLGMQLHDYPKSERIKRPVEILTELGLAERMHHKPDALSEGQRQRVAIGRALINDPQIILADEPTAALDKDAGRQVVSILRRRSRENNCTIMIVTHDSRILDVADRVIKLVDGHIISDVLVKDSIAIGRVNPLQNAAPHVIKNLADKSEPRTFSPGATVIRDGEIRDKCYYIKSGRVEVVRHLNGHHIVVDRLGPGSLLGEWVLVKPKPRKATVRALEELTLIELPPSTFSSLIQGTVNVTDGTSKDYFY